MNLIIVESPTKSKTISKFLSPEYKVYSSYGHIRDLPEDEFGVDVEQGFKPKYIIIPKARKTVQFLKKEVEKSDLVLISTDPDREGEAIAYHLVELLNLNGKKPYQRIVFHEIMKQAIEEALKNPRKVDMDLVDAQQARRILDRLVGYKLSPFLWKKVARGLSAGRVQSVAVRLVVEREKEIQNFKPEEYWSIVASLLKIKNQKSKIKNNEFEAILIKKEGKVIPKLGIKSKEEADKIVKDLDGAEYKVINIEKKEIKRNPLPPFSTSTLQQEAWKRFHWPAKMTMRIAQQLYERGLTTYHRTDSLNLSDLSLFIAKKFIFASFGKNYWAGFLRKYKTKTKGAQEAHEAIRPTYPEKEPEKLRHKAKLEDNQLRLYDLIWRRFIACQMAPARFDSTTVEIEAGISNFQFSISKQIPNSKSQIPNYTFRAAGQTLKFDGFLKVYPIKFEETELPLLKVDEILELIKLIPSQHFTQPPSRYSEATLIKVLEENGIGRPSTYAPILSTIQERNYVIKNEQKKFQPTEIGIIVNNLLVEHFPKIVDIKFTAEMEENLDKIAQGKKKWVPTIKEFYEPFAKQLEQKYQEVSKENVAQQETEKKCPKCGSALIIKLGRFGKFYACSNFPKCRHTEPIEKPKLGIKCPQCSEGEIVEKKTKTGKIFYACNQWPKCDFALWEKPINKKCQKCGSLLVETKKGVKCSNKGCNYLNI